MSLTDCLKLVPKKILTEPEREKIREETALYQREGLSHAEAARKAVLNMMEENFSEVNDIRAQAGLEPVAFDRKAFEIGISTTIKNGTTSSITGTGGRGGSDGLDTGKPPMGTSLEGGSGVDDGAPSGGDKGAVPEQKADGAPGSKAGSGSVKAPGNASEGSPGGRGGRSGSGDSGSSGGRDPRGEAAGDRGDADQKVGKEPARPRGDDHVIAKDDALVPGGNGPRAKANIKAISLLKKLEAEDRPATLEERQVLAQFSGWGSLAQTVFRDKFDNLVSQYGHNVNPSRWFYGTELEAFNKWKRDYGDVLHPALDGLMTKEEWAAARASTLNAHYTDRPVIEAMWDMAQRLGFGKGVVLEPSAGIGHFFGLMPPELRTGSKLKGVELDALTGRMLQKLYPNGDMQQTGFQDAKRLGNNTVDLVISNFPFGDFPVTDAKHPDYSGWKIHNYFFARSIDTVRPGGMVIGVTSHYTMDAAGAKSVREYLSKKADLVAAIRLPGTAFEKNAGTSVTTDIILLRKKDGSAYRGESWTGVGPVDVAEGGTTSVNEYFINHPEMVLGQHSTSGSMYGGKKEYTLLPNKDIPLEASLKEALGQLPEGIFGEGNAEPISDVEIAADKGTKEGLMIVKDGKPYVVQDGALVTPDWAKKDKAAAKKATTYVALRETTKELLAAMRSPVSTDAHISSLQAQLNAQYDAFVEKYGRLNENKNEELFDDVEFPNALALEQVNKIDEVRAYKSGAKAGKTYTRAKYEYSKSPIFSKRTVFPVSEPTSADNLQDALGISQAYKGRVDVPYIAKMLGVSDLDALKQDLLAEGHAFENPVTGLIETADEYLSGNVVRKLREAEAAEAAENIEALKKVQPPRVPAKDIDATIGATWIPDRVINRILGELGIISDTTRVKFEIGDDGTTRYDIKVRVTDALDAKWGVEGFGIKKMLDAAFNLRQPKVVYEDDDGNHRTHEALSALAQDKLRKLQDAFQQAMLANPSLSEMVENAYNEAFNNYADQEFRVPPNLERFPGAVSDITLNEHQLRGVIRGLRQNTLFAHGVGAGKTFMYVSLAMEMRRLGLAKKPMIVVENSTIGQFVSAFKRLYPGASILAPRETDNTPERRQRFMGQIATGDWDSVIVPLSFFERLSVSPERETAFINDELEQLHAILGDHIKSSGKNNKTVKYIEKMIKKRVERLTALVATARKDKSAYLDNLGVDGLLIDEAHNFKRGDFFTKLNGVKGVDTGSSQRSTNLMLASRLIREQTNGRNVHLATGTPISNTMAEAWTMIRYIRPDLLSEFGVSQFDDFASTFCSTVSDLAETATGSFKQVEKLGKYMNMGGLSSMWRTAADIILEEDLKAVLKSLPDIKGGKPQELILERSPHVAKYIQRLKAEREAWDAAGGDYKRENSHVPLLINTRASQAAIDLRLVDSRYPDDPMSKTNRAVEEVFSRWKELADTNVTQAIFCDKFRSSDKHFNLFEDIKAKLIAKGVPAEEIAITTGDKVSKAALTAMFDKMNTGEIRIIMGSTGRMGVGVNIQERLGTLHHLNAPDTPKDWQQRNGRGIRQGNMNKEVEILAYGVKNTLDSLVFQRLQDKQAFINQILRGKVQGKIDENPFDDVQISFADLKAAFAGNPLVTERVKLDSDLRKLRDMEASFISERNRAKREVAEGSAWIPRIEQRIKDAEATAALAAEKFPEGLPEKVNFNGKTLDKKDFLAAIKEAGEKLAEDTIKTGNTHKIGFVASGEKFQVEIEFKLMGTAQAVLGLEGLGAAPYMNRFEKFGGLETVFNNFIAKKVPGRVDEVKSSLEDAKKSLRAWEARVEEEFPRAAELEEKLRRKEEIDAALATAENTDLIEAKQDSGSDMELLEDDLSAGSGEDLMSRPTSTGHTIPTGFTQAPSSKANTDTKPLPDGARRSEIINKLRDELGVTVRFGGVRRPAAGIWKIWQKVARVQKQNNVQVTVHELAHAIMETKLLPMPKKMPDEVKALAQPSAPKNLLRQEGFAEFVRLFVTSPADAMKAAPDFYEWFDNTLQDHPDVGEALYEARETWNIWQSSSAVQKIGSLIRTGEEAAPRESLGEKIEKAAKTGFVATFNAQHPLKVLRDTVEERIGRQLPPSGDPYLLAVAVRGVDGQVEHYLTMGSYQWSKDTPEYEMTGPSLKSILEPVYKAGKRFELDVYLVAKRAMHDPRIRKGYEGIIAEEDFKTAVAELENGGHPEVIEAAEKLWEYGKNLLRFLVESGRMSQEQADYIMAKNLFHSSLYKIMMGRELKAAMSKSGFGNVPNPVKTMRGSSGDILSPSESYIYNTVSFLNAAARNKVSEALIGISELEGMGDLLEAKPLHQKVTAMGTQTAIRGLAQILRDAGTDKLVDYADVLEDLSDHLIKVKDLVTLSKQPGLDLQTWEDALNDSGLEEDDLASVAGIIKSFSPDKYKTGPNEFIGYKDGLPYLIEADPYIYSAIMDLAPYNPSGLVKFLSYPASWLRAGATVYSPEFGIRNVGRDTTENAIQLKGFLPIISSVDGLLAMLSDKGKGESLRQFYASGAAHAAMVSLDRDTMTQTMRDLTDMEKRGLALGMEVAKKLTLMKVAQIFSEYSEVMTRLGAFRVGQRRFGKDLDGSLKAMLNARSGSVDFKQRGSSKGIKDLGQQTPFMNPSLQGVLRFMQSLKADYEAVQDWYRKATGKERKVRTDDNNGATLRALLWYTVPTLMIWAMQKDRPEYQEINPKLKALAQCIVIYNDDPTVFDPRADGISGWMGRLLWAPRINGKGYYTTIILPRAHLWGAFFSALPEAFLNWSHDKQRNNIGAAVGSIVANFAPPIVPTWVKVPNEAWNDYNSFTDRPITPRDKERVSAHNKYSGTTSETSKLIARTAADIGLESWGKKTFDLDLFNPSKLDYAVTGLTGGAGRLTLNLADKFLKLVGAVNAPPSPSTIAADLPVTRAFFLRSPSGDSASIRRFYSAYENEMIHQGDLRLGIKSRDLEMLTAELERQKKWDELPMYAKALQKQAEILSANRAFIHMVETAKEGEMAKPEVKRRLIDQTYNNMTKMAKNAVDAYDAATKKKP